VAGGPCASDLLRSRGLRRAGPSGNGVGAAAVDRRGKAQFREDATDAIRKSLANTGTSCREGTWCEVSDLVKLLVDRAADAE
jgi:hypothetical protein